MTRYPAGAQCWVETLQPDPGRACDFYASLFEWDTCGDGRYTVARLGARAVAGIGQGADATWITRVVVADVEATVAAARAAGGSLISGPVDAAPSGRLALVGDPGGAILGVWETDGEGAQVVNEPGSWALSTLHAPDPERAIAFYGRVLGWRAEPFGASTLWRLPGYAGGIPGQPVPRDVVAIMTGCEHEPRWSVDFRVRDADAIVDRAVQLGAAVVEAPHELPGFRTAVLADPQGATFSITRFRFDA